MAEHHDGYAQGSCRATKSTRPPRASRRKCGPRAKVTSAISANNYPRQAPRRPHRATKAAATSYTPPSSCRCHPSAEARGSGGQKVGRLLAECFECVALLAVEHEGWGRGRRRFVGDADHALLANSRPANQMSSPELLGHGRPAVGSVFVQPGVVLDIRCDLLQWIEGSRRCGARAGNGHGGLFGRLSANVSSGFEAVGDPSVRGRRGRAALITFPSPGSPAARPLAVSVGWARRTGGGP